SKDHIVKLLTLIADDVRQQLAGLGAQLLREIVGRTDLLVLSPRHEEFVRQRKLDLSYFLDSPSAGITPGIRQVVEGISTLNKQIFDDAYQAIVTHRTVDFSYDVSTSDRAVLAYLSGEIARRVYKQRLRGMGQHVEAPCKGSVNVTFTGSAGQGFCVFLVDGINVRLFGEANDSVCKSMSGGNVIIQPHPRAQFSPEDNVIIGNCALYGATGGNIFVRGLAGDRFAVRNSGATAVVEGTGLHACEYMTKGTIAILGKVSYNVGAGMTGGTLYLNRDYDEFVNKNYLSLCEIDKTDELEFRTLIEKHFKETGSFTAREILTNWELAKKRYVKYVPINFLERSARQPFSSQRLHESDLEITARS
ncbi:MAG: glutamate synthase large subunit, partial [Ignavibacteriales bacterium]|nr:glutamate synthase large subunit [Ignavibacteriales bacterium]